MDIVDKLWRHVQDENVKESILSWEDHDIPDIQFDDFTLTKYMAEKNIQSRMDDVLTNWERQNHFMENATDSLRSIFISEFKLLTTESGNIKAIIEDSDEREIEEEESTKGTLMFVKFRVFSSAEFLHLVKRTLNVH